MNSIGISGAQRLDRIEHLLEKVLDKLSELSTQKADAVALRDLEGRVREIELHGSATAVEASSEIRMLHEVVNKVSARITWATGAMAAVIFFVNIGLYGLQHFTH